MDGFHYEAGSVMDKSIKQRVADMFAHVAPELGQMIAARIGVDPPQGMDPAQAAQTPADMTAQPAGPSSPALSQSNTVQTAKTRKVAILAENGFCGMSLQAMLDALKAAGAMRGSHKLHADAARGLGQRSLRA